jgi:hypothetical protein
MHLKDENCSPYSNSSLSHQQPDYGAWNEKEKNGKKNAPDRISWSPKRFGGTSRKEQTQTSGAPAFLAERCSFLLTGPLASWASGQ